MRPRTGDDDEALGKVYDHEVASRLARYLKPYRHLVALTLALTIVYSVAYSASPRIIGYAIDRFIDAGDLQGLNVITAAFIANAFIIWASEYIQAVSMARMGQGVLNTLRTQIFDHLQKLSLSFYDRNEVGKLMSRAQNDVLSLQELLTSGVITVLEQLLSIVVVVIFLFSMNVRLALVTLAVVPLLVVIMAVWQGMARTAFMRVRQAIAVVNAGLQENISGVRVIQSLGREDLNSRLFDQVNHEHFQANLQAGRLSALVQPTVELLVAVATMLVIIYGGGQALAGELAIGELVAFTLYIQRFFDPIRQITMQYTQFQRAMVGGVRIFEILDARPEIQDAPDTVELPPVRGEVRFEQVSFQYHDNIPVLHDINLHVRPGETVAFVGQTGAGKTTMIALISRFYDVTAGRITIDGYDLRAVTQRSLRRQMGIVLQEPFLFTDTVRENIRYGRLEASDEAVEQAARAVGAHDFIVKLERGYDTVLHERGGNLSVGQRQLLALARAVLADPKILILDEATAYVDTQTEILIQRALKQLLRGRTSFVIAHRLSTIRDADRVVVLDRGRVVEQGTHDELLVRGGLYANLYTMSYSVVQAGGPNGRDGHGPDGATSAAPLPQPHPQGA
ncbi:MAG: ABC transporter ATP-binding protein [Chloroflexi bacterium]|nr:ABC transporter ATP-binding protein [Chloroflexota bacterium]